MTLCVQHLSVSFSIHGQKIQAVDDISFTIAPGEIVGLVGESGSGKSATADALTRLSSSAQIEGQIFFDGIDLLRLPDAMLRQVRGQKIGHIFQDPLSSLNPTMRIGDQIAEGIIFHKLAPKKLAFTRALELLEKTGIANPKLCLSQYPHHLSGGMRQRALIALAIACNPTLLIADEPTTALDPVIANQILKLLQTLQRTLHSSLLLITHDLRAVAKICDRVLVMYRGKIVEEGPLQIILHAPKHPYTKSLMHWRHL